MGERLEAAEGAFDDRRASALEEDNCILNMICLWELVVVHVSQLEVELKVLCKLTGEQDCGGLLCQAHSPKPAVLRSSMHDGLLDYGPLPDVIYMGEGREAHLL